MKKHDAPPDVVFSPEGLHKLQGYDGPGKIKGLQNVVERSVILRSRSEISAGDILLSDKGKEAAKGDFQLPAEGISLEEIEKSFVEQALSLARWQSLTGRPAFADSTACSGL